MKSLVQYRNSKGQKKPTIGWNYVLFRWNDRKQFIEKAIELAREAQIDDIFFRPTTYPFYGISWRYHLGGFIKNIGQKKWIGRELDLNSFSEKS